MLEVKVENIIPVTEARDSFNQLVDKVEGTDEMYVLTKNGKPSSILVGVHHLEKLTGTSHEELMKDVEEPAETPVEETPPVETAGEPAPVNTPVAPAEPVVSPQTPIDNTATAPVEPVDTNPAPLSTLSDDGLQKAPDNAFSYDNSATTNPVAPSSSPSTDSSSLPPVTPPAEPTSEDAFALPNVPVDTSQQDSSSTTQTTPPANPPASV